MPATEALTLHRSRKRFRGPALYGLLWGLALFGAVQAALGVSVEAGWVAVKDPIFSGKAILLQRYRAAFRPANEPTRPVGILIIGSSRTLFGCEAARLSDVLTRESGRMTIAVNFGTPGAGPMLNNLYLRRLLAAGYRPDFLVIELMPVFLAGQVHPPPGWGWLPPSRLRDDEFAHLASWNFSVPRMETGAWDRWLGGSYLYRSALLAQTLPKWVPNGLQMSWDTARWTDDHGWCNTAAERRTAEQYHKGLAATWKQYAPALTGFALGGPNCAALRDVLELCRTERLPAALLLMPESSDFRAWQTAEALDQVDAFLAELRSQYGVPVIDARAWVADTGFSDGHHLLKPGARQFTDRLGSEWILRWLRGEGIGGADANR